MGNTSQMCYLTFKVLHHMAGALYKSYGVVEPKKTYLRNFFFFTEQRNSGKVLLYLNFKKIYEIQRFNYCTPSSTSSTLL